MICTVNDYNSQINRKEIQSLQRHNSALKNQQLSTFENQNQSKIPTISNSKRNSEQKEKTCKNNKIHNSRLPNLNNISKYRHANDNLYSPNSKLINSVIRGNLLYNHKLDKVNKYHKIEIPDKTSIQLKQEKNEYNNIKTNTTKSKNSTSYQSSQDSHDSKKHNSFEIQNNKYMNNATLNNEADKINTKKKCHNQSFVSQINDENLPKNLNLMNKKATKNNFLENEQFSSYLNNQVRFEQNRLPEQSRISRRKLAVDDEKKLNQSFYKYYYYGRSGGGAPIHDSEGKVITRRNPDPKIVQHDYSKDCNLSYITNNTNGKVISNRKNQLHPLLLIKLMQK